MLVQTTYNAIDCAQWEDLVSKSRTGSWFQSPEAYTFFASQKDAMEPFVVGVQNTEYGIQSTDRFADRVQKLRGVCVGYVTKEKSGIKQFFTRRAIIQGGVCVAEDATNEEVSALLTALRAELAHKCIYIEMRNFEDYSKWKETFEQAGFAYQKHLNFHFDCTDKERIWSGLSETRRRQIRKSEKKKVTIEREDAVSEKDIRDWYRILEHLYRTRVKRPVFKEAFFLDAYRQGVAKYLLVKYEGKVIGGMMIVVKGEGSGCVYEWYICGMDGEYKDQYPSVVAMYGAMEYANAHHLARLDVMGAGQPDVPYGVRDFKAEFGGAEALVEYGRFLYVANPLLYKLGTLGVKIQKLW
ncbi:MAG: GNAT family N-acetyltransferase [Paludibacteraceae bacterium]|nr:GNAT family N-acetyltransferase [Paludibacteraceae bacterium]